MTWRLIEADCVAAMRELDESSVDAICTDPPYGLEFMGKEWDRLGGDAGTSKPGIGERATEWPAFGAVGFGGANPTCATCGGRARGARLCGCLDPDWRVKGERIARGNPAVEMQEWHETWAVEALRVLKPGGHLVAFGGTRTYHRLACALEDAGFEIRDCLAWLYGSGFPKSLDVSKAIDKKRHDYEDTCVVALWLRPHVERVGFDVVTKAFGFKDETMARARWTSRSQPQVPSWDQWERLRGLCGFGDEMDAEVWRLNGRKGQPGDAWSEREVVGDKLDRPGYHLHASPGGVTWSGMTDTEDKRRAAASITAPATPEAQRWQGWGTALKPAFEPIVLARKPLAERNVAANVLAHGTGALNVDGTRIGTEPSPSVAMRESAAKRGKAPTNPGTYDRPLQDRTSPERYMAEHPGERLGRWPANVILDEEAAAMLDEQSGERAAGAFPERVNRKRDHGVLSAFTDETRPERIPLDTGGASRFFYTAKTSRAERERGVRDYGEVEERESGKYEDDAYEWAVDGHGIPRSGRVRARNNHPTVKPVDLMAWLCRLITPPGGLILDPFTGSGSTGIAALREGFSFIGIERDPGYVEIARARIIGDAPLLNVSLEVVDPENHIGVS